MAIKIIRKETNSSALLAAGLISLADVLNHPEPDVVPIGVGIRVMIVADTGCWKYKCKKGDLGVVTKIAKAYSIVTSYSKDDLYFVRMDKMLGNNQEIIYLTYAEIAVVE